jgi:hypothetical protein
MWLQFALVTLDKLQKNLIAKNNMWHQIAMVVT